MLGKATEPLTQRWMFAAVHQAVVTFVLLRQNRVKLKNSVLVSLFTSDI